MEQEEGSVSVPVMWRGKKFTVTISSGASVKEFGDEVRKLTDVKADTLKLIVPQSSGKTSLLLEPFSDEHSYLRVQDTAIVKAKVIRMMGVLKDEVDEVLKSAKENQRIAGFEEEERKMKMRMSYGPFSSPKLPEGQYIFCGFRTLELPGIELNPPPSEALKRMHMLAADPGIVAIMNKHRWRVGIMTELAPVGYVGISPKCILGFNKNKGEEISLRLRTDDLKGFRKYESIRKTLLHELAHMVHSEHDANFYALDKQLNQEATTLDWTRSSGRTVSGAGSWEPNNIDMMLESESIVSHKLGGETADIFAGARAASVAAAYHRLSAREQEEPDPDDLVLQSEHEANPNECPQDPIRLEPDPDDSAISEYIEPEPYKHVRIAQIEPGPDDADMYPISHIIATNENTEKMGHGEFHAESLQSPDPGVSDFLGDQKHEADTNKFALEGADPDDPVAVFCNRLTKAIETLRAESNSTDFFLILQTLLKITRNVLDNPNEIKYRRLRKANPVIQKSIAKYKAAIDVLLVIGFSEEAVVDETGKAETYMVLKRDDPGVLWLAKSLLESCNA